MFRNESSEQSKVRFKIFICNSVAHRTAKTLLSFGHSECSRVKGHPERAKNENN